jgi:hypothetical protein
MTAVEMATAKTAHVLATPAGPARHAPLKHHKQIVQNARDKVPIQLAKEISVLMRGVMRELDQGESLKQVRPLQ